MRAAYRGLEGEGKAGAGSEGCGSSGAQFVRPAITQSWIAESAESLSKRNQPPSARSSINASTASARFGFGDGRSASGSRDDCGASTILTMLAKGAEKVFRPGTAAGALRWRLCRRA